MKISGMIAAVALAWLVYALPLRAETVTLNLKDADIGALISTVAEVSDKNFIVDPRVKGKVTVISSRPMSSDEVYQVFLSILKVHGFAAVPSGEVIKIIPDVNAKQDSIPTTTDREPGRGDEMVTRVIQVDNVAAAQLVPILRPLVPQQGHLAAYPATNVLIISDRANNVERLVSIIRRIDQVSDSEIEVIPLAHASANEVVRVLTSLTRASAAGKAPGGASEQVLVADERTNSVLLGGERAERLRLRAIISHLDTPLDSGGNTDVIYLRYADAKDIVSVLMGVGKIGEQDASQGKAVSAARGSFDIQADESTNALVISAPPDIMRTLRRVISQLDIRKAQVLVEAVIAEVSDTAARELGVQWLFADTQGGQTPVGVVNFSNSGSPITDVANAVTDIIDGSGGSLPAVAGNVLLGFGDVAQEPVQLRRCDQRPGLRYGQQYSLHADPGHAGQRGGRDRHRRECAVSYRFVHQYRYQRRCHQPVPDHPARGRRHHPQDQAQDQRGRCVAAGYRAGGLQHRGQRGGRRRSHHQEALHQDQCHGG